MHYQLVSRQTMDQRCLTHYGVLVQIKGSVNSQESQMIPLSDPQDNDGEQSLHKSSTEKAKAMIRVNGSNVQCR